MPVEVRELLPFEIVKEPWNDYIIKDEGHEVTLRGRLILAKVVRIIDKDNPKRLGIQLAPHQIWITHSPSALRGTPSSQLPAPASIPDDQKKIVEVETRKENWSVYRLPADNVDLQLRLVVTRVYRVPEIFAMDGEPYYLVESAGLSEALKDGKPAGALVDEIGH